MVDPSSTASGPAGTAPDAPLGPDMRRAARLHWTRFEPADAARLHTVSDLVRTVERRYRYSGERARRDVALWLRDFGGAPAPVWAAERVARETVTFAAPFKVEEPFGECPPGVYEVETVEELIDGLSFPAYRLVSTALVLPGPSGAPRSCRMVRVDPAIVQAARAGSGPPDPS